MEPFDITLIGTLREHGIFTHITTDHPHYFEIGGENYCQMFHTWNFERGQEGDVWVSRVKGSDIPEPHYGKVNNQNQLNRLAYTKEEEYPTPRTFRSACDWIDSNRGADDYFMMVEAFDPHEPSTVRKNIKNCIQIRMTDRISTGRHTGRWMRRLRRQWNICEMSIRQR